MKIDVRYFAAAREATGMAGETLQVPTGSTIADLRDALVAQHAALATTLPTLRFALDEDFADAEAPLHDGALVALIPPVGGG